MKVYHHCLFGTRYDFLCANYTAFDQTLFNCNFVSNVDCENSKNFWHRNDDLYKAESTTTAAPVVYNFYTPAPQALPLTPSPGQLSALPPAVSINPRRPASVPRTRPHARVRPAQIDYYEDEYEELPRPKTRKRRPRPRPVVYYDDYEEYEDDRITRRGGGRRRAYPRRDRPLRRNKDRRNYDDDEVDYRYEDDDLTLGTKQKAKRRKLVDDYEYEDDRRDATEKRRPQTRRDDKPPRKSSKRPVDDDYEEEDEIYERRKIREESRKPPRLGKRRPPSEDYEDDLQQADEPRSYERPRKINKESTYKKPPEDGRPIIKPVSGTIYDRPRVAPKINLPVPKNAADKFAYKSVAAQTTPAAKLDDEEYENYEEPLPRRSENSRKGGRVQQTNSKEDYSESPLRSNARPKLEVIKERDVSSTSSSRKRPTVTEYDDYEDDTVKKTEKLVSPTTSTTESTIEHYSMPIVRKFKRPFLPSRGGNPYSARSLQPVGVKALNKTDSEKPNLEQTQNEKSKLSLDPIDLTKNSNEEIQEVKPDLKPVPVRVKSPLPLETIVIPPAVDTSSESSTKENNNEEPKPGPVRIKVPIRVKSPFTEIENAASQNQNRQNYKTVDLATTAKSKLIDPDILNENYDVTLNEAISPIIPSIPVRSFSGFNTGNDYTYKRFQRPTKYVILDPVVSAGSTYYVK